MEIMLIFAGLVKIQHDWLNGLPLSLWLSARTDTTFFGSMLDKYKEKLLIAFPDAEIQIEDVTGSHAEHSSGLHVKLDIVSEKFEGKSLVEQHKIVYQVLAEELKGEIHALKLHTRSK